VTDDWDDNCTPQSSTNGFSFGLITMKQVYIGPIEVMPEVVIPIVEIFQYLQ